MWRLYSQLLNVPLRAADENVVLGRVTDLVIDPDRGDLVAVCVGLHQVIAPMDLLPFEDDFWAVKESDALLDAADLIRLATIDPARRTLVYKPVFTQSGESVGKVADYVLNMETLSLTHLYVNKSFFSFVTEQRVFEWKQILEITSSAVIVKEDSSGERQEVVEQFNPLKKKVEAPLQGIFRDS